MKNPEKCFRFNLDKQERTTELGRLHFAKAQILAEDILKNRV